MAMTVVTQNADGSLTFATNSLGPITSTGDTITIAGQFALPATEDPRIAIARTDAAATVTAAQKVVADLA
jgi:hypothetical protein